MYVNRIKSMAVCVYEILNIELKPMSDVFFINTEAMVIAYEAIVF